jgi:hypothetical protein
VILITNVRGLQDHIDVTFDGHGGIVIGAHTFLHTCLLTLLTTTINGCLGVWGRVVICTLIGLLSPRVHHHMEIFSVDYSDTPWCNDVYFLYGWLIHHGSWLLQWSTSCIHSCLWLSILLVLMVRHCSFVGENPR